VNCPKCGNEIKPKGDTPYYSIFVACRGLPFKEAEELNNGKTERLYCIECDRYFAILGVNLWIYTKEGNNWLWTKTNVIVAEKVEFT